MKSQAILNVQKSGTETTTTNQPCDDDRIRFANRCHQGAWEEGRTRVVDVTINTPIEMAVFWPFWSDDRITDREQSDARAIRKQPDRHDRHDRRSLGHTPTMNESVDQRIRKSVQTRGDALDRGPAIRQPPAMRLFDPIER